MIQLTDVFVVKYYSRQKNQTIIKSSETEDDLEAHEIVSFCVN